MKQVKNKQTKINLHSILQYITHKSIKLNLSSQSCQPFFFLGINFVVIYLYEIKNISSNFKRKSNFIF